MNQNSNQMAERESSGDRGAEGENGESAPRIVVSDAPHRSRLIIAKSRSQLTELDTLLRGIMNRPMN